MSTFQQLLLLMDHLDLVRWHLQSISVKLGIAVTFYKVTGRSSLDAWGQKKKKHWAGRPIFFWAAVELYGLWLFFSCELWLEGGLSMSELLCVFLSLILMQHPYIISLRLMVVVIILHFLVSSHNDFAYWIGRKYFNQNTCNNNNGIVRSVKSCCKFISYWKGNSGDRAAWSWS